MTTNHSQAPAPLSVARFTVGLILVQKWRFLANMLGFIVFSLAWLVPGFAAQQFFDLLSGQAPATRSLWTVVALIVGGQLLHIIGLNGIMRTNVPFQYRSATFLHKNLLGRILELPGAAALPESPGAAIGRARDDVTELSWFPLWLNDMIGFVVLATVALSAMIRISPLVTLISLIPLFGIMVIAQRTSHRIEKLREATQAAGSRVTGFIAETFGAVQAVQVARAEDAIVEHFATLNERRRQAALIDRLYNEFLHSLYLQSGNLSMSVILFVLVYASGAQTFSVGDFSLFAYQLPVLAEVIAASGQAWARYTQNGVSLRRLQALLGGAPITRLLAPGPTYQDGSLPTISALTRTATDRLERLTATDLSYCHPGSARGVFDVNLELGRGSFTVITGRVGSGKTTLVRTLLGLLPKTQGEVTWNGAPVVNAGDFFAPPRCAYTAQLPRLFSTTLRENLLLGLPSESVDLPAALTAAVLDQDVAELEQQLDTLVGPKGVKLSGGQIQRAAAARMFVRDPELLVFDDLSSALDVETEQKLWQQLFARPHRPTCLVVSHRRAALRQADHILVLKDGRVIDEGKLEALLERCEEMQKIWSDEKEGK